uniref:Receptor-like serine/threonine-protein kinase n=1 Tax=Betula platyphylla TaxID=78630 RepID=A0A9E9NQF1_BETPL|nr:birch protein [Betula platyphylla]
MMSKPWLLFAQLLILSCYRACFSIALDTLSRGHSLSGRETLLSQGGTFELGFFQRGTPLKTYLGIWYKRFGQRDNIVWVANRENPLSYPSSSTLNLSEDGNLLLFGAGSSNTPVWSTKITFPRSNLIIEAVLGEDGNFVLRGRSNASSIYWESFDHPTDTWLPGSKYWIDKVTGKQPELISWKNSEDPAPGAFSLGLDPNGSKQICLEWNRSQIYWRSGVWNGSYFSLIPEMRLNSVYNFSFVSNKNGSYFTHSLNNPSHRSKLVVTSTGKFQLSTWLAGPWVWNSFWSAPRDQSDVYSMCGAFGVLYRDNTSSPACECLKGFEPFSMEDTRLNDWSGGCVRKFPLQCENNTYANGTKDWFMKIPNLRLPVNSKAYSAVSSMNCEVACMKNCSCTAYAYNRSGCMIWEGALLNLELLSDGGETGQDIYLRLAADQEHPVPSIKGRMSGEMKMILVIRIRQKLESVEEYSRAGPCNRTYLMPRNLLFKEGKAQAQSTEIHGTKTKDNASIRGKDVELPVFSYGSVSAATNNFSTANKLGEGGFGPVYKGKSLKGQEIAVKMLSKQSGQGLEEFRNETTLIAKLQHRNLVKLLGCCMERDEKMLIYEYMPNKSLDSYIFGPCIACFSIAGDTLSADFGMAQIVGGNETQANTNRIVGTYGYMSPEYAMNGLYSIKSDVFSFGVLVLEIVSGRKNTGFYNSESLTLLKYAWELWRDDQSLDLMEPTIGYPSSTSVMLRFINIGLLCVQESPTDRPTMFDVVSMISNEHAPLPTPKQPAFTTGRNMVDTNSSIDIAGNCSTNSVTISSMEAR